MHLSRFGFYVVFLIALLVGGALLYPVIARNRSTIQDLTVGPEERVARARELRGADVRQMAERAGLPTPIPNVFFRAFKEERELELWGASTSAGPYVKVQTWPIAGMSGDLGPKRREGDRQVPEGVYFIDRFNPRSDFRLSLGLNYPNSSDRIRSDREKPGSDIFIHGDVRSIGCLAMTDAEIDAIYLVALDAKGAGQDVIPVHIFPFRMTPERMARAANDPNAPFWRELQPIYDAFETNRRVPQIRVEPDGAYRLKPKP